MKHGIWKSIGIKHNLCIGEETTDLKLDKKEPITTYKVCKYLGLIVMNKLSA